jgi:hypothetical protein
VSSGDCFGESFRDLGGVVVRDFLRGYCFAIGEVSMTIAQCGWKVVRR